MAMALTLSAALPAVPTSVMDLLRDGRRGVLRSVAGKIRPRIEARLRAEEALARLTPATDPLARLRIEAIAISNAMPGAPMRGDPGKRAASPYDRLLSLRIGEAAERRREREFAKTLFGLSAPPAWMTTLTSPQ